MKNILKIFLLIILFNLIFFQKNIENIKSQSFFSSIFKKVKINNIYKYIPKFKLPKYNLPKFKNPFSKKLNKKLKTKLESELKSENIRSFNPSELSLAQNYKSMGIFRKGAINETLDEITMNLRKRKVKLNKISNKYEDDIINRIEKIDEDFLTPNFFNNVREGVNVEFNKGLDDILSGKSKSKVFNRLSDEDKTKIKNILYYKKPITVKDLRETIMELSDEGINSILNKIKINILKRSNKKRTNDLFKYLDSLKFNKTLTELQKKILLTPEKLEKIESLKRKIILEKIAITTLSIITGVLIYDLIMYSNDKESLGITKKLSIKKEQFTNNKNIDIEDEYNILLAVLESAGNIDINNEEQFNTIVKLFISSYKNINEFNQNNKKKKKNKPFFIKYLGFIITGIILIIAITIFILTR